MGRLVPRVWMTVSGAPGTGVITLGAAVAGPYRTFATAGVADGETVSYGLVDGNAWECGQGVYSASAGTLTRTVEASSNANAAIAASSAATVYIAPTARDWAPKIGLDTPLNDQIFNASGTWAKPPVAGSWALIELWGGGMGGGKGGTNALRYGGSGGSYQQYLIPFTDMPTTASATVGAGGAGATTAAQFGAAGGSTSFLGLSCFGGAEDIYGDASGYPTGLATPTVIFKRLTAFYVTSGNTGIGTSNVAAGNSPVAEVQEHGGRGPVSGSVGNSRFSGGRGAGATAGNIKLAASTSTDGGSGADSATTTTNTAGVAGSAPGGGGSAGTGTGNGGAGAAGRVRVRIY